MKSIRNIFTLALVFSLLFTVTPAFAVGKPDTKVNICHREDSTGNFHLISVSQNAKDAHLNHGDFLPGSLNSAVLNINVDYYGPWYYTALFTQEGDVLSGTLTDPYITFGQQTRSITGSIVGTHVVFSFDYGLGSVQSVRTYEGEIQANGDLVGTWSQTGVQSTGQKFWFTIPNFLRTCSNID